MERIGIRELRQQASAILRRVSAGETFEITDRGRPVALLVGVAPAGFDGLKAQGLVRLADGDLLDIEPVPLPRGARLPSELVSEGRTE